VYYLILWYTCSVKRNSNCVQILLLPANVAVLLDIKKRSIRCVVALEILEVQRLICVHVCLVYLTRSLDLQNGTRSVCHVIIQFQFFIGGHV
jgi:hypothetical protein